MAQTDIIKTVENLITIGYLKESDLVSFANEKLRGSGLRATTEEKTTRKSSKTRKAKSNGSRLKSEKPAHKTRTKNVEYPDGRTNKHAILFAMSQFEEGCRSKELQEKLSEIGHEMESNVFNTQLSVLKRKDGLIKTKGKQREFVYSLNAAGRKALDNLENPSEPEPEQEQEGESASQSEEE